jgi:hypothetical protein
MPVDDKTWRARDDAHTLAMAEEIKADSARLKAAAAQAKKMLAEKEREAKAMAKLAKMIR